ncbi:hypothetical protein RGUI_2650 [Rhodovulum sp. P5]|nr:hypothetical protein RGUI_2650 [Rhodovulum sp. P5]
MIANEPAGPAKLPSSNAALFRSTSKYLDIKTLPAALNIGPKVIERLDKLGLPGVYWLADTPVDFPGQ